MKNNNRASGDIDDEQSVSNANAPRRLMRGARDACPLPRDLRRSGDDQYHLNGGYSGKVRRRHRDTTMHRTVQWCRTRWGRVCRRGRVAERRPLPGVRARLLAWKKR